MESANERFSEAILATRDDLSHGLLYTHTRINDHTKKILESTSFLYGLIELLSERGILSIEELDDRKRQVAERLVRKFTESGLGLMYQDPEYDKYAIEHASEVDCERRALSAAPRAAGFPLPCPNKMSKKASSAGNSAGPTSLPMMPRATACIWTERPIAARPTTTVLSPAGASTAATVTSGRFGSSMRGSL